MGKVIVVSAHPDDMEIGMGGTVAKLVDQAIDVISVVITDGRRSSSPNLCDQDTIACVRKAEAGIAAKLLGISKLEYLGLHDIETETNRTLAINFLIEKIHLYKPEGIYSLHPELDRHPTHRTAGTISLASALKAKFSGPIWGYEVWGLFNEWDRIEIIDSFIEKKASAIAMHKSQTTNMPYGEGVIGLNRWHAVFNDPAQSKPAGKYAEVFKKLR